jgi:alpha-L-fucosidase
MAIKMVLLAVLLVFGAFGQPAQPRMTDVDRTAWFRDAKLGMFIHWGPYSVIGRHEWARHRFQIPQAEYDKFARAFNPVKFNADAWVDLARNAGAKYIVITSKHHDGFSIFRSKVSDYDMEITPYPGDPLKMLADSARRRGIRLGFYHSIMDWHHPDYRPRRAWEYPNPKEGGNNARFVEFLKAQIRELLTGYGDVAVMWFDGEWEHTLKETGTDDEIYELIRQLQPNTLINDRLYERQPGKGDFGTPEQFVPATGIKDSSGKPILWEACVTINGESWGYNKYETEFKTERDLIRMLVEVVSKGGNLLLNVGPKPDGTIQDEFVTRLNAMGDWMKVNSEAIYGTTASPFAKLPFFGRATTKGNRVYLHVFQWPAGGTIRVPGLKNTVHRARLLANPKTPLPTSRDGDDILVNVPSSAPDEIASVIELTLDGPAETVPFLIRADEKGTFELGVESSEIETRFEQRAKKENLLGHVYLTRWTRPDDIPTWTVTLPKAGAYQVDIAYSAGARSEGTEFTVVSGANQLSGKVRNTGSDLVFKSFRLGTLNLPAGEQIIQVKAVIRGGTEAMNLEKLTLTPSN